MMLESRSCSGSGGWPPAEAAEALLELATGGTPERRTHAAAEADPFGHPDAQRRFRLVENTDELERALEFPWEKWTVFLHPAQRRIAEGRVGTVSAFNGPEPSIMVLESRDEEIAAIADWLAARRQDGFVPHEIAVFVRSMAEMPRAQDSVYRAGMSAKGLDERSDGTPDSATVGTMHLVKGLKFRAVVVMACDDEVLPLQSRVEDVADQADLEDTYSTERHLLYVVCTRARDHLLVTGVDPASEFLDDL